MPNPTPGQIAYEAFAASMTVKHASWGMPSFAELRPAPDYQHAWEAAAQAVLDASTTDGKDTSPLPLTPPPNAIP